MERPLRTSARIAALCTLVVFGIAMQGAAAVPGEGTTYVLDSMTSTASWSGEVAAGVSARGLANTSQAYTGVPANRPFRDVPCAPAACDMISVDVALPAGTWSADAGG